MSLNIDTDTINGVLLACGWMDVKEGTFDLDAYEYISGGKAAYQNHGQCPEVCAHGACWVGEDGQKYSAPLTSVLAVRGGQPRKKKTRK